jgi:hypothetical protein
VQEQPFHRSNQAASIIIPGIVSYFVSVGLARYYWMQDHILLDVGHDGGSLITILDFDLFSTNQQNITSELAGRKSIKLGL